MPDIFDELDKTEKKKTAAKSRVASGSGDIFDALDADDDAPVKSLALDTALRSGVDPTPPRTLGQRIADVGAGFAKGAGSTAAGAGKIAREGTAGGINIFGVQLPGSQPESSPEAGDAPENVFADFETLKKDLNLEPTTTSQKVGFMGEQILESFLPGSLVDKSIKATRGLSTGKRIADAMWREAASSAGTAAVQTGGDPLSIVTAGATGGLVRGAVSTPVFLRDTRLAKEMLDEAQEFGIPLTKAEQTQGWIRRLTESIVRRSVGGHRTFAKFDIERNQLIKGVADSIANSIDDATPMDRRSLGVYVQKQIQTVREVAGKEYESVVSPILDDAGDMTLDLGKIDEATGKYVPSPLVQSARDVISRYSMDELAEFFGKQFSIEDVSKAYSILKSFANPIEETAPEALDAAFGAIGSRAVKQLSLRASKHARSLIFKMSHLGDETTEGKAALQEVNAALHNELKETLIRNGMPEEAEAFEEAGKLFKSTVGNLETDVLERVAMKDSPEVVAKILRGAESETAAIHLTKAIGPDKMKRVQASLLQDIIDSSVAGNDIFDVNKFKVALDNLRPEGLRAIYGDSLARELTKFAHAARRFKITDDVLRKAEGTQLPFMAQVSMATMEGAAIGTAAGFITGDAKTGAAIGATTLGLRAGGTVMASVLAKMMTKPHVVADLTKSMTVDPMTAVGKQVAARVAAYASQSVKELEQEANRKKAEEDMHRALGSDLAPAPVVGIDSPPRID